MSVVLEKAGFTPLNTRKDGRVIVSGPATHNTKQDIKQGLYANDLNSLARFYKKGLRAFS